MPSMFLLGKQFSSQAHYTRPPSRTLDISSPLLSQNRLSLQTLPTPTLSSHCFTPSLRSLTSPRQTRSTNRRRLSLTRSRSTALFFATRAGATPVFLLGTHSDGRTDRATRASAEGRAARRRESRMHTSERASLRDTTVVRVRKMDRRIRSASDGRNGDQSIGGRIARVRWSLYQWSIGARERSRSRCDVCTCILANCVSYASKGGF